MLVLDYFFNDYCRYRCVIALILIFYFIYLISKHKLNNIFSIKKLLFIFSIQFLTPLFLLKTKIGEVLIAFSELIILQIHKAGGRTIAAIVGQFNNGNSILNGGSGTKIIVLLFSLTAIISMLLSFKFIRRAVVWNAKLFKLMFNISEKESLYITFNSCWGQIETPLVMKNYFLTMSKPEIFTAMVSAMCTVNWFFVSILLNVGVPYKHLLISNMMAIPGTVLISRLVLQPDKSKFETKIFDDYLHNKSNHLIKNVYNSAISSINYVFSVCAVLISIIAIYCFFDNFLCLLFGKINSESPLSLNTIFSYISYPFAYSLGFSNDTLTSAQKIIGTKICSSEIFAFIEMGKLHLSERSSTLLSYLICGFSSASSIAIQVAGIGYFAPKKIKPLISLVFKAATSSFFVNFSSALIIGLII